MKNLTTLSANKAHKYNGGYKVYGCPWNDYSSRSYWSTYGHAIKCAYRHGFFRPAEALIRFGLKLYFR